MSKVTMASGKIGFDCKGRLTHLEEQMRFVESQFAKPQGALYECLGEIHSLIREIGSDGERILSLDEALKDSKISERQKKLAKTVVQKISLYVFVRESKDLVNKSTRSLYTRALALATEQNLQVSTFVEALKASGVYTFANPNAKFSKTSEDDSLSAIESRRRAFLTEKAKDTETIGLIGGKNPANTFAIVLYRVDNGQLVPCKTADGDTEINAFIKQVLVTEQAELEERAEAAAKSAAAAARSQVLSQKVA